jgi:hypothetical protein
LYLKCPSKRYIERVMHRRKVAIVRIYTDEKALPSQLNAVSESLQPSKDFGFPNFSA